jgi:hypothetical protein
VLFASPPRGLLSGRKLAPKKWYASHVACSPYCFATKVSSRTGNGRGFCGSTVAVELLLAREIVPEEAEILLVTIPTGVAFAAN